MKLAGMGGGKRPIGVQGSRWQSCVYMGTDYCITSTHLMGLYGGHSCSINDGFLFRLISSYKNNRSIFNNLLLLFIFNWHASHWDVGLDRQFRYDEKSMITSLFPPCNLINRNTTVLINECTHQSSPLLANQCSLIKSKTESKFIPFLEDSIVWLKSKIICIFKKKMVCIATIRLLSH